MKAEEMQDKLNGLISERRSCEALLKSGVRILYGSVGDGDESVEIRCTSGTSDETKASDAIDQYLCLKIGQIKEEITKLGLEP
jgi:hypothetical protein